MSIGNSCMIEKSQSPYRVNWFVIAPFIFMKALEVSIPLSGQLVCNKVIYIILITLMSQSPYRVNWFVIIENSYREKFMDQVSIPLSGQLVCNGVWSDYHEEYIRFNPLIGSIGL